MKTITIELDSNTISKLDEIGRKIGMSRDEAFNMIATKLSKSDSNTLRKALNFL